MRSVYAQDHILQDLAVDLGIFRHGFFDTGQLGRLLVVGDRDTALPPGFLPLTKGSVVDLATEHQHTLKHPLLFRRGLEFVLVGLADPLLFHTPLFCLAGERPAMVGAIVALSGHPAFIPMPEGRALSSVLR
jgi:hypothetical protein